MILSQRNLLTYIAIARNHASYHLIWPLTNSWAIVIPTLTLKSNIDLISIQASGNIWYCYYERESIPTSLTSYYKTLSSYVTEWNSCYYYPTHAVRWPLLKCIKPMHWFEKFLLLRPEIPTTNFFPIHILFYCLLLKLWIGSSCQIGSFLWF